jgi:uncharacterized membrane protein HdeD (DUF308 family)
MLLAFFTLGDTLMQIDYNLMAVKSQLFGHISVVIYGSIYISYIQKGAKMENDTALIKVFKVIGAAAAVVIGGVLLLSPNNSTTAEAIFVGTIALVCGLYVVNGTTKKQGMIIAAVLFLLAVYSFAKAFEIFDTALIRRIAGGFAVVSGIILAIPALKSSNLPKNS